MAASAQTFVTDAVVLRLTDYCEADRVVTLLTAARTRRAGLVLVTAAIGIVAGDATVVWATGDLRPLGFLALATVPLAVGVGLLFHHRMQLKDLQHRATGNS